jgi:hypothetical protein
MEVEYGPDIHELSPRAVLSFVLFPILTNTSILLFEIFALDIYRSSSDPSNILGVVGLFFYYLGCLLLFIAYGRSTGGWGEFFGTELRIMVACLVITYPIFYLFWLPFIIYQLLVYLGTPHSMWERLFNGTAMSTELLLPDFNFSTGERILRCIYIGVPFVIFSVIVVGVIVMLTPLWYFILSPVGFGTLGICLHISLHFPHSTEMDILERIGMTFRWGVFVHVWGLALPFAVIAITHLVIVGVTWFGVILAIFTVLQFIVDVVPSTINVLRTSSEL